MEFKIEGGNLPILQINMNKGELIRSEAGAMSFMSPFMVMSTTGDGLGKIIGRALSGDTLMQNIYTAHADNQYIAFSSNLPGQIRPFEIKPGNEMIFQRGSYLCSTKDVTLSVHFRKKLVSGLFSGEGFLLQKVSGTGIAFAEFDGHVIEKQLAVGEKIIVDTGNLAAMTASCSMDIQTVSGVKNVLLGGEGLFNTIITGPGTVYLQSMPVQALASKVANYIPRK